jgi:hypothetical protein
MTIRFQKHYVTDGSNKARVRYSNGSIYVRENGRVVGTQPAITLYAKDYLAGRTLEWIFQDVGGYENNTDSQTDYFEKGLVRIFPTSPLWAAALERCNQWDAHWNAKS